MEVIISVNKFFPYPATSGSVGYDLFLDLSLPTFKIVEGKEKELRVKEEVKGEKRRFIEIEPGMRVRLNTGVRLMLPDGLEAQVRARSGLSYKKGLMLLNGIGTIDSDYRGYIYITFMNCGNETVILYDEDRIAQLVFNKVEKPFLKNDLIVNTTERGEGGFGSTGI